MRSSVILLIATSLGTSAQTPKLQFEVASVKRSETFNRFVRLLPGGRLRAVAPLSFLIEKAFNVPAVEILGAPAWMKSENYQIEAKADGNASSDQLLTMLRSLLEDRFQLKIHRQTKELPVYLLLPAKSGLKLPEPKEANCWPPDAPPQPPQPPGRGRRLLSFFKCGLIISGFAGDASQTFQGGSVAMPELARALSLFTRRPVIDKTGFDGTFDLLMTFAENFDSLEPGETPPAEGRPPSIFIALQEKLGLRLESSKGPVEILVIDSVERPSGN